MDDTTHRASSQEGVKEGLEEGREEGIEKGEYAGKIQILQELLGDSGSSRSELLSNSIAELSRRLDELQRRLRERNAD